jgi:hypothetical protein
MADNFQGLLDTLFLTRQSPISGLLSPEEQEKLKTQQLIGTGLGLATGLASNWNKGVAGAALGGYTGAVGGRQAPIDAATKNFMTTTELSKMMQDIQKGGLEVKALQGQDIARQAKVKEMRALGYNDTDIANFLIAEKDVIGAQLKSDPRFRPLGEIKGDELSFYGALGIDPSKATAKDKQDFLRVSFATPDKDVAAKEVERATFNATNKDLVTPLPPVISQSQMLQNILKERSGQAPSTGFAQGGATVGQQKVVEPAITTPSPSGKIVPIIDDPNQILDVRATLKKSKAGDTNLAVKSIQDLSRQEKLINDILNSKGFNQAFGFGGATSSAISGSDAAYTKRLLDQLKAKSFVGSIVEMKGDQGSTGFGQLAVSEGAQIKDSQSAVDQTLDPDAARVELTRYLSKVQDAKRNLSQDYKTKYGDLPAERIQEKPSFKTDKGVITDAIIGSALPTKILQEYQGQINPNEYYKVVKGVPYKFRKKQ